MFKIMIVLKHFFRIQSKIQNKLYIICILFSIDFSTLLGSPEPPRNYKHFIIYLLFLFISTNHGAQKLNKNI